jgi:hypothetical protein
LTATTDFLKFLKWGDYHSKSKENPDTLKIMVTSREIFDTEFSTNTKAIVDGEEKIIPLWNFASKNKALLQNWKSHIATGKIKEGMEFSLTTYGQQHPRKKEWKIRRWDFHF